MFLKLVIKKGGGLHSKTSQSKCSLAREGGSFISIRSYSYFFPWSLDLTMTLVLSFECKGQ